MLVGEKSSISAKPVERDLRILRSLFECRVMSLGHVAALHFGDNYENAKKALQRLKSAGLVGERERQVNEASALFLARRGLSLLSDHGVLSEYPECGLTALERRAKVSELTLRHELAVMDVKAAFHRSVNGGQYSVQEFTTWPMLNQFESTGADGFELLVKPDGFIRIHEQEPDGGVSEHTFYLELDRSSETQDTLVSRAGAYFSFYKSGGFAERQGAARTDYKDYPFRVLFVLKSAERRNNLAERLLRSNPPIFTHACLATFEDVKRNPLGAIWMTPRSYREATAGTPFDVVRRPPAFGYQRQTAREIFVEEKVKKERLLGE